MPKCSLIVNVYNQAKQLDVLLESALKQTNQNFEIIIADDGSSDETEAVVKKWNSKLDIRRVWHEDRGFYRTIILNSAAKLTTSDYLIFVDGDMILHHRFIEMHLKYSRRRLHELGVHITSYDVLNTYKYIQTCFEQFCSEKVSTILFK